MEKIHIALAADSNYLVPTTVVLHSIFANNADSHVCIYLLHLENTLQPSDLHFLSDTTTQLGGTFHPLEVKSKEIEGFPETRHGKATLLRLCLPTLLPHIDKLLYLDGDIVVNGSLKELFSIDLSDFYCAAARDSASVYNMGYQTAMGIGPSHFYFNAGVMLLNLAAFRKLELTRAMNEFVAQHYQRICAPDQDFLNHLCQNKTYYIEPRYNLNFALEKDVIKKIGSPDEIEAAKKEPIIVHYIGRVKPWSVLSTHPKRKLWWSYLQQTSFANYRPKDACAKNYLRKWYLLLFKTLEGQLTLEAKKKMGRLVPSALKKSFKKSLMKPV